MPGKPAGHRLYFNTFQNIMELIIFIRRKKCN